MVEIVDRKVSIVAKADTGLKFFDSEGEELSLAVIDKNGNVVKHGDELTKTVFSATVQAQNNFWSGTGQLSAIAVVAA